MDYTLDQLRVLDAIHRTGTFGGAARELHRVPSAVSYAVKQLEEAVGVPLFDRSSRTPRWTPAGRRMLDLARRVLAEGAALEHAARELRQGWEPELRVVVDGALPLDPVLACLRRFSEPDIPTRLRLDVEYRAGVLRRFEGDRAHLMLVIGFDPHEDTSSWTLSPLPPLELLQVGACGVSPEGLPSLAVRDSLGSEAAPPPGEAHVVRLSDFHSKRLALLQGVGVGWMPRHLVTRDLEEGRLRAVPNAAGSEAFTYHPQLVARADAPLGRAGALFVDLLQAKIQKS